MRCIVWSEHDHTTRARTRTRTRTRTRGYEHEHGHGHGLSDISRADYSFHLISSHLSASHATHPTCAVLLPAPVPAPRHRCLGGQVRFGVSYDRPTDRQDVRTYVHVLARMQLFAYPSLALTLFFFSARLFWRHNFHLMLCRLETFPPPLVLLHDKVPTTAPRQKRLGVCGQYKRSVGNMLRPCV